MNNIEKISTVITVGTLGLTAHSVINNQVDAATVITMQTTANLNVRTGPGTNYPSVGLLAKGTTVKVVSIRNNWAKLNTGKYVSSLYLKNAKSTTSRQTYKKGQVLNRLVIVNTYYNKIYLCQYGKLVWSRPIASGKYSTPTPVGQFQIVNKIKNPYYSKGNIKGGSPSNPLGVRWCGIGENYGIHGNSNESSIGKKVSNGCIRLHNYDVIDFYNRVSVGDRVVISNKPNNNSTIANWYGYKVY